MAGFLTTALLIGLIAGAAVTPLVADETGTAKTADTFFAGTVSQFNAETIIVGRTVRGKAESRTFSLTPQHQNRRQASRQGSSDGALYNR